MPSSPSCLRLVRHGHGLSFLHRVDCIYIAILRKGTRTVATVPRTDTQHITSKLPESVFSWLHASRVQAEVSQFEDKGLAFRVSCHSVTVRTRIDATIAMPAISCAESISTCAEIQLGSGAREKRLH